MHLLWLFTLIHVSKFRSFSIADRSFSPITGLMLLAFDLDLVRIKRTTSVVYGFTGY